MLSSPLISISVVSHGDGKPLVSLLESLTAFEHIGSIQLIVTDNLREDLPELAASGWHSVAMLRPRRPRGFGANHNAAFQQSQGSFFCVLNPDVTFTQGVLTELVRHVEAGHGDLAAPLLVDSRGTVQDSFRPLPTPWGIVRRRLLPAAAAPSVGSKVLLHPDWIAGMFMLMRASTFSALGGFDERFRLYFEDVDFCTRLRLAGMTTLIDPELQLLHNPRRQSRRPGVHLLWHVLSAGRFFASDTYRRARRMHRHA